VWKDEACGGPAGRFRTWTLLADSSTPSLVGTELCMPDQAAAIEWDVFIRYWGRNSTGDPCMFDWTREFGGCVCEPDWTGPDRSTPLAE
jgi:hypothetical protein